VGTAARRIALGLACLALSASAAAAQEAPGPAALAVPRFEPTDCWVEETPALDVDGVVCGYLVVPERRDEPEARLLRLAVAILPALSADKNPDPVLYLHGGPGGFAIASPRSWLASPLRRDRDLILLDQRGVGFSEPRLCPDLSLRDFRVIAADHAPGDEIPARVAVAVTCRDQLLEQGIDLGAWNSTSSARDVEDLRTVLGIEEWNLLGVSYGTRLALAVMRETRGAGLRSVVLDSAYPPWAPAWDTKTPDFARALDEFMRACEGDRACDEAFPHLRDRTRSALEELIRKPVVTHPTPNDVLPDGVFVNNAQDFAITLHQLLYDSRTYASLPLLLDALLERNPAVERNASEMMSQRAVALSRAVNLIVECYERAPFQSHGRQARYDVADPLIARVHTYFDADYDVCAAWSDAHASEAEMRPVRVDVPTLILAGRFDPITPPQWGERTSRTLPDARFLEFPVGHGAYRSGACPRAVVSAFVDDPSAALDTRCIERMPAPDYWTRVRQAPDAWTLLRAFVLQPDVRVIGAVGGGMGALVLGLLGFGVRRLLLRWRGHRAAPAGPSGHALVLATAWTALAFWAGLLGGVFWVGANHPLLSLVGLPYPATAWLWLPVLGLGLAVAAAARLWSDWDVGPRRFVAADLGLWGVAVWTLGLRFLFDL